MKTHNLTQVQFDRFFEWLSANRDEAAETYELFRAGLVRFFLFKGCDEAETLADETLNRVALKFDTFSFEETKNRKAFIYGFATKVRLEYLREKERTHISLTDFDLPVVNKTDEETEIIKALKDCLSNLKTDDKKLVLEYYSKEKAVKIEHRTEIADRLGLNIDAMYMKIYRIRKALRNCVDEKIKK